MNLGQMVDAAYRQVQDSARSFVKEADVEDWINEAMTDLDARLRFTRAQDSGTTSGNTIALPLGLVEILSLRLGTDSQDVLFVSDEDWNAWAYTAGAPAVTVGRVFGSNVELYPTPTTGTAWTLRSVKEPTRLTGHSDTPTLPTSLHRKLVAFAAGEAAYQDDDFALGDRKKADYERGLPAPPTGLVKLQPGPYNVQIEPGPFDSADAAHI